MSESCGPILQDHVLLSTFNSEPRDAISRRGTFAPAKFPITRSLAACAFLLVYLAAYLSVGFAGVRLIEDAWSAIVR